MKITKKHASDVLKSIAEELKPGVIMEIEIPDVVNFSTGEPTGFAVIVRLSTRYHYPLSILEDWKKRLQADACTIKVVRNQLRLTFSIH